MVERPLRIVQISTRDIGGGAENIAYSLHSQYREMGHRSVLVVGSKRSNDPDVLAIDNSGRRRGVGIVKLLAEQLLGWQYLRFPGSHRIPELVGESWDIAHLHNLHGKYFDLAALPCLSRLAPTILMMHDGWLLSGHCAHHFGCFRWKTGCGRCPDLNIYPGIHRDGTRFNWKRKRKLIQQSRVWITAPSQWILDEAQESLLAGKPMRLVRNGVDLGFFSPGPREQARTELNLPQNVPIVLFSANMSLANSFKDGPTLLTALNKLIASLPRMQLIALGGTTVPPGFESLANSIISRPFEADPRRVALYYRASDLLAHASRVESCGLTILEAMACGIPVVASAVGGIPEYLEHERTGLLVPPQNADLLAAAIRRLLEDRELSSKLVKEAMKTVTKCFNIKEQARSYLVWYQEMIQEIRRETK